MLHLFLTPLLENRLSPFPIAKKKDIKHLSNSTIAVKLSYKQYNRHIFHTDFEVLKTNRFLFIVYIKHGVQMT